MNRGANTMLVRLEPWIGLLVSTGFHAGLLLALAWWKLGGPAGDRALRWVMVLPEATTELEWLEEPRAVEIPRLETREDSLEQASADTFEPALPVAIPPATTVGPGTRWVSDRVVPVGLTSIERLLEPRPLSSRALESSGDYAAALSSLRGALADILMRSDLLLVWCFDESISMVDDQQIVAEQLGDLYGHLLEVARQSGYHLGSVVTSYGENFHRHLLRPVYDLEAVAAAIRRINVDPTGHEMLCEALLGCLRYYAPKNADSTSMAIVVVTDEAGEWEDSQRYLEEVIQTARRCRARIFFLGREAAFGQAAAEMLWQGTRLRIDRGPETAFVRRWPCDAFGRKADLVPSGFGPYAQCRLAHETGGLFFMLRGQESLLLDWRDRSYDRRLLDRMQPDWRSLQEQEQQLDAPWRKRIVELAVEAERHWSSGQSERILWEFPWQAGALGGAREESQRQARRWLSFWQRARQALADTADGRRTESDLRWQADWDLMFAQAVLFELQVRQYLDLLDQARYDRPPVLPLGQPPLLYLVPTQKLPAQGAASWQEAVQRLENVIRTWPNTPWAAVAELQLARGCALEWSNYPIPRTGH
ncbi:MAG: hypothetical protein KatS3mg109_1424 [Pirellulaceae bacterium]|nr:MAG: hypothetical protein KatS3mg109_1424 [Pirellulaceae bacterium]